MIELAKERGKTFEDKVVGISHAGSEDMLNLLKEQVIEDLKPKEIMITEIGCTIGTHAGPVHWPCFIPYKIRRIKFQFYVLQVYKLKISKNI